MYSKKKVFVLTVQNAYYLSLVIMSLILLFMTLMFDIWPPQEQWILRWDKRQQECLPVHPLCGITSSRYYYGVSWCSCRCLQLRQEIGEKGGTETSGLLSSKTSYFLSRPGLNVERECGACLYTNTTLSRLNQMWPIWEILERKGMDRWT